MIFLDRHPERARLDQLMAAEEGLLAVVFGRRRVGKTRLLVEWTAAAGGVYTVADESTADLQRLHFARALADRLPGFADVVYPDWRTLLARLAKEAALESWRGPIVFDELPYLVNSAPELPSVLQQWIDHDARQAKLVVAVAGSSQRMMQGIVLDAEAPLYGRAAALMKLAPLPFSELPGAFGLKGAREAVEYHAAWGGIPRYWELASVLQGDLFARIDQIVLDPLGPLHREPDRLLLEELPPATELRPLLDSIGLGAHRVSEIAGRVGRPATSLGRALQRLQTLDLVDREIPFGEPPKRSKRSLYKIADPFLRLWFSVVAPNRSALTSGSRAVRMALLVQGWTALASTSWESLCRSHTHRLDGEVHPVGALGPWMPAGRWWQGNAPEWDVVTSSLDGERLLLGEAKWQVEPTLLDRASVTTMARNLASRPPPRLPKRFAGCEVHRVLFVPETKTRMPEVMGVHIVTAKDIVEASQRSANP